MAIVVCLTVLTGGVRGEGKEDIVANMVERVDTLSPAVASDAFDAVFVTIREELERGERVYIPAFGTFSVSHRGEREVVNPQTGVKITIPATNSVRFKASRELKDAVNRALTEE